MDNFCASLWPEDPIPHSQKDCRECGLFEHGSRMVWGEGNPDAPIMIILDNPGARENREGNPFVCGTRQTLQKAANVTGLEVKDLYVTFILKRRPIRTYDKEKTRETCMIHLKEQLTEKKPKIIFCLGNVAVQSFFQNPEAEVKMLRGSWHHINGFKTAVAYHPLAIRRRPNLEALFLSDWRMVAEAFKNMKA
ncbi:uracil-DNA glycosylase [Cytobacillus depressus]|uniref:Uracil-DNA glycosylase n=1 Tax=Cytobacillus depressus TaxID=1602942 RepID=A0A6L3VEM2_9BACI|nr:uracil-DNA glycosylase [Cytobacillus depressus]KAB2338943.1 uracil-DNA glycosylase [Cytobacillus depressus]